MTFKQNSRSIAQTIFENYVRKQQKCYTSKQADKTHISIYRLNI